MLGLSTGTASSVKTLVRLAANLHRMAMWARMAAAVRMPAAVGMPETAPVPTRIVDAHHHLWDLSTGRYPWLQGPREDPDDPSGLGGLQKDYLVKDFLDDVAGTPVAASVHVEAAGTFRGGGGNPLGFKVARVAAPSRTPSWWPHAFSSPT